MSGRAASRLSGAVLALALALLVASFVLAVVNDFASPWDWGTRASSVLFLVPGAAFSCVGAVLAARHPRNAVGWICLGCGLGIGVAVLAAQVALYGVRTGRGDAAIVETGAWLTTWDYLLFIVPLGVYLVLLFPHGRLPSRRWLAVVWLGGISALIAGVSDAILPGPLPAQPTLQNPYAVDGASQLISAIGAAGWLGLVSSMLAAAGSMVGRFRRATGIERQQIKWFALAAAALAVAFFPVVMIDVAIDPNTNATRPPFGHLLAQDVATVLFAGLPIATAIAILRHRLYDIDVVINRTLVYASLTATLAATYLASVLLLQRLLAPVTEQSDLAIAGSTLAVAGVFRPARRRIQAGVDRRFYRRRYDAARTLERFGTRLRDEVDLDALAVELRAVVGETMQPAHASLWLREPERAR